MLAPVIDLKSRRDDDDIYPANDNTSKVSEQPAAVPTAGSQLNIDYNLDIVDEYNPLIPNEYEKVIKELRDYKDKERVNDYRNDDNDRESRKNYNRKRKTRYNSSDYIEHFIFIYI